MAVKPIIFSAPMVRALLAGTKTQTRRLVSNPEYYGCPTGDCPHDKQAECNAAMAGLVDEIARFAVGDRVYVREAHQFRGADYGGSDGEIEWFRVYGRDGAGDNWDPDFPAGFEPSLADQIRLLTEPDEQEGDSIKGYVTKLRPSIHMPRWASRMWLEITDVRVQRLQDISEADCVAEGIQHVTTTASGEFYQNFQNPQCPLMAYGAYRSLWDHINGEGAWADNPWIVAYTFTVHEGNVDA